MTPNLGPKWRIYRGTKCVAPALFAESAKAACELYADRYAANAGQPTDPRMYHAVRCQ